MASEVLGLVSPSQLLVRTQRKFTKTEYLIPIPRRGKHVLLEKQETGSHIYLEKFCKIDQI